VACGGGSAKPHDAAIDGAAVDGAVDAASDAFTGPFRAAVPLTTGAPGALRLADLDGDGLEDILVITNGKAVTVFRNTTAAGATMPAFAAPTSFDVNSGATLLVIADFNGDGKPDVAAGCVQLTDVSVLLSTSTPGTIGFAAAANAHPSTCLPSPAIAAGDVDGDTKPDLVLTCSTSNVEVLSNMTATGATTPAFTAGPLIATGGDPAGVALADVDGDHDTDIVTANGSGSISVLANNGSGSFPTHTEVAVGQGPDAIVAADLDGDTFPEIVTGDFSSNQLSVLANHAGSGFSVATTIPVAKPLVITAADIDGDHDLDLAAVSFETGPVSLAYMNGTQVAAMDQATAAQEARAIAVGDINGDGKPDLVISDLGGGQVLVRLAY